MLADNAMTPPEAPIPAQSSELNKSRVSSIPQPGAARGLPLKKPIGVNGKEMAQDLGLEQRDGAPSKEPMDTVGAAGLNSFSPTQPAQPRGLPKERPSSPNAPSAASSMIFERNVQEPTLSLDIAPAIPAHIKTEDQIPPALEAASLSLTDDHLAPDEVEIVTHVAHQPASAAIPHGINSAHQSEANLVPSVQDSQHEQHPFGNQQEFDDVASTYGSLDPNDVKRLSFISFADVVHAEHVESSSQSLHQVPISGAQIDAALSQSSQQNRALSPARSPISTFSQAMSPGVTTPPTSASGQGSTKGLELSPARSQTGSPHQHGELAIESLSQALRKTASRDLSGFNRSPPSSAV